MSICPHCGNELKVPERAYFNCDQYGTSAVVATECCGHGVRIQPVRSYRITVYDGNMTDDDWGVPFKSKENA